MKLLRLELSGFKSFGDKTAISFDKEGISLIVGPNGCGKSNIVDAIRWTLGEQSAKHLRGANMEDVIFNGCNSRKPVGMAQVNLIFSNPTHDALPKYTEFNEISITRRLYRSGESQYLINKTPCRLTDIRELFMDTGIGGKAYSIIEQGKIDQVVTARAEERRSIIDEAAGIVKFKTKKREAERKFAATKQNLQRVEDILAELEEREERLKVQVELAEEYLHAKGRLERLKKNCEAATWSLRKEKREEIGKSKEEELDRRKNLETEIASLETKESAMQIEIALLEKKLDDIGSENQRRREDVVNLENRIKTEILTIDNLKEWLKKSGDEIENVNRLVGEIGSKIESCKTEEETLKREAEEREEALEYWEESRKVLDGRHAELVSGKQSAQQSEIEAITRLTAAQNQITQLQERLLETQEQREKLGSRLSRLTTDKNEAKQERQRLETRLSQTTERKQICFDAAEEGSKAITVKNGTIADLKGSIAQSTKELHQKESRLRSLRELAESHEDFDSATKILLDRFRAEPKEASELGFHGTFVDLIATEKRLTEPFAVFLNRYFNLMVFSTFSSLGKIVGLVEKLKLDQIQVCFLDLLPEEHGEFRDTIAERLETNLLQLKRLPLTRRFRLIDFPLQTLSAERLRELGGAIDSSAHLMTGDYLFVIGKQGAGSSVDFYVKRRNEMTGLEEEVSQRASDLEKLQKEESRESDELEEMTSILNRRRREIVEFDLQILGLKKEIETRSGEILRLEEEENALRDDRKQMGESQAEFDEKVARLSSSIVEQQLLQEKLKVKIDRIQVEIEGVDELREEASEKLQDSGIAMAGLKEKIRHNEQTQKNLRADRQRLEGQLAEIEKGAEETERKKKTLVESVKNSQEILPVQIESLAAMSESLNRSKNELETRRASIGELQNGIRTQRRKTERHKDRIHTLEIELAQLDQEINGIENRLFEEFGTTPTEVLRLFDPKSFSMEEERKNVEQLQKRIALMDNVNLGAKKEYDSLRERLDFLKRQSADLLESIEALESSISKINAESRRRFKEVFHKIDAKFGVLFPDLFGGGEAHLRLTDEDDLLESGVEIIAQPPGKNLQSISLLSGGEKALTAIALIFAIFQIKPSPFCLLDEVDAPLDEANSGRFNRHVVSMTESSQFIIITHNKKTMEIGDTLFGVTMEEPGISKIVSVDFNSLEESMLENRTPPV